MYKKNFEVRKCDRVRIKVQFEDPKSNCASNNALNNNSLMDNYANKIIFKNFVIIIILKY